MNIIDEFYPGVAEDSDDKAIHTTITFISVPGISNNLPSHAIVYTNTKSPPNYQVLTSQVPFARQAVVIGQNG